MYVNPAKRTFDLVIAAGAAVVLAPIMAALVVLIWIVDGRPVFYVSERMRTVDKSFGLVKFRSMKSDPDSTGVTGGDKAHRYTRFGGAVRRYRLDELPQLWNVLKGDMSLVGPRPPLRQYTEEFPHLYNDVLKSLPGITGMASVQYHRTEEDLLAQCTTSAETDEVYRTICIPAKAELDIEYARSRSIATDIALIFRTVFRRYP